jgi:hypothetical protein
MLAVGALLLGWLFVVGLVLKTAGWIVLWPLRLVGFALILPFLLLKLVLGLCVGLAVMPVVIAGLVAALAASLIIPLLPLIFLGALLWMVASLFSRPAVSPYQLS